MEVTGFVDLDNVGNQLRALETEEHGTSKVDAATHLLVLVVRGLATGLRFPFAHFATTGIRADNLMTIVWQAIKQIEACGLGVVAVTCDGARPNRKFIRLNSSGKFANSVVNPYSRIQQLFLMHRILSKLPAIVGRSHFQMGKSINDGTLQNFIVHVVRGFVINSAAEQRQVHQLESSCSVVGAVPEDKQRSWSFNRKENQAGTH